MTVRLAVDTATEYGSVAVGAGGVVAAELVIGPRRHGAALAPAMQACLDIAGLDWAAVDGVVLADGPGSFTGLRVGFGTVKGVLARRDVPLRTVPSLMSAARSVAGIGGGPVVAMYDALRGQVFAAVYEFVEGRVLTLAAPALTTVADLEARLPEPPRLAVGEGALRYSDPVSAWTGLPPVGPPEAIPRAGTILSLADLEGAATPVDEWATLEPRYGRLAEAQVRWEREHGHPLPDSDRRD